MAPEVDVVNAAPEPAAAWDRAWGQIPQGRLASAWQGTFTRRRIERIAAIAAAVGCFVLGIQAFFIALGNNAGLRPGWTVPLLTIVFGSLVIMCGACFFRATARVATGAFAVIYIVMLAIWPLATAGAVPAATPEPWPWYLINVATIAAVIAFPFPLQLAWTIATPVLYGIVRVVQGGFQFEYLLAAVFEVPYSLILGGLLMTLVTIFRRMASGVDRERARTVAAYAQAAEAQAAQEERVAVSALMHDSVLAALIAAERADGPRARSLAMSMAREALEGLADTGTPSGGIDPQPATMKSLARGIQASLADLGLRLQVRVEATDDEPTIPGTIAAAMIRAATQAAANAIQHADGVGLEAIVRRPVDLPREPVLGTEAPRSIDGESGEDAYAPSDVADDLPRLAAVEVVVSDKGPGFDIDAVPDDRLGISASILARIAAIDGEAVIDSGPHGTVVTLRWREVRR
ncbi:ATP-binding protein [Microbacterium sp. CJ77]|uniref:ATP-binding protein n=1 Tax=Microbacterium sp. CJ77 TaxID=2079201 RepID=UPI000CD899F3|nr:ATP-binding protein [Microbacterium sp. CJ77]